MLQAPNASTAFIKSKAAFHERNASFSSSIQSNDSVFTDTDVSIPEQNSGILMQGEDLGQGSSRMGSSYSKSHSDRPTSRKSLHPVSDSPATTTCKSYRMPASQYIMGKEAQPCREKDKRSPKDSAYGSRLNTDELQSPSLSNKSCPASPTKLHGNDDDALRPHILPLANSPILINSSYFQFYYLDDPVSDSFSTRNETPIHLMKHHCCKDLNTTASKGTYPNCPILPPEQSKCVHKKRILKSLQPIKSASCSSLDKFSLTSSLEEYASNLEKVDMTVEGSTNQDRGIKRERLLSVTRFKILTSNLESPQCARVVKVVPVVDTSTRSPLQEKSKQRKRLLGRFHIGRWKTKQKKLPATSPHSSKEMVMTPAGEATLRKGKRGKQRRQRMVVSDDLTHQVHFSTNDEHHIKTATTPTAGEHTTGIIEEDHKRQEYKKRLSLDNCSDRRNLPSTSPEYFMKENHISSFATKMSQSADGLSDLKHLSAQLRKLAQPAQSTTNLDLSQRASETMSTVGLRASHSVDDLTDLVAAPLSQSIAQGNEPMREGFLWRVLGRASQRWPAYIHIVPIQNSLAGINGLCVRKGQQVLALYRVSNQVVVEMETNHLACIPYECCRISRKHYGLNSNLVQLSYSQLYAPVPELFNAISQSPLHTTHARTTGQSSGNCAHVPIEMVAIQDSYDCKPLGEINVDAGDKLRVLYCDEQLVYAVKENGEAGLLERSYCRLTRKSEKMYQKWVELTHSPFQADYPVIFNKKPPNFLIDGTLMEKKGCRLNQNTPTLDIVPTEGACFTAKGKQNVPNIKVKNPTGSVHSRGVQSSHKALPPTPPPKIKEALVASLTADHKSALSPPQPVVDHLPAVSTLTTDPLAPSGQHAPSLAPTKQEMNPPPLQHMRTIHPAQTVRDEESFSNHEASNDKAPMLSGTQSHPKPMLYTGKLMTVVQNYVPQMGTVDYTIRKGLRVRVLQSSPDGKTLRVATKTGTQFDIPVSHLCFSRKNSEPSSYRHVSGSINISHEKVVTESILGQHGSASRDDVLLNTAIDLRKPPSPTVNLPLECGKIMTVIHNFVPTQEGPMVTIRRGLRVKVLGGQDDKVKVCTKTGTTFYIPRSHLRLSHKTLDASTFTAVAGTDSQPKSPLTFKTVNTDAQQAMNPHQRSGSSKEMYPTVHSSLTRAHISSSSPSGMHKQSKRKGNNSTAALIESHTACRGYRVNTTGSQVFELC